ncbi:MAG TPA: hypothetical protein DGD08_07400 [Gemmatimonas aurantiaca]|uniref:Carboxypeptidase regulatory-like domain-containing protein n=2 Tax=Gemmatimonas aurantiaca TaxID=173480 RepID=C1A7P5_GEMAT|nr:carboxypeptidase-like regulatory domain-containing protein [Gemmatimonas aurantiaca]BAH38255.1 hypothetical protein GAU_1213 [Gemmatimonas aurantiaca T-27]HCT57027.1 hypothetical protein [Gemmatimonas aurantiaca]
MRPFRCVPGSFLFVTALMLIGALRADAQSGPAADTVRGLAYDSLSWQPLAGALVTAEPGGESAVSDSAGRFFIVSSRRVDRLVAFHERTDRLGLGELVATRPEGPDAWARPIVSTPGINTIWARLCAPARRPGGGNGGIVFGSILAADGTTRVAGLGVVLQWESVRSLADTLKRMESITTRSDSLGNYVFCGVQDFGPAAVVASSSSWRSGNVLVEATPSSVRRRDLVVGPTEGVGAFAAVQGRVVDESGASVAGATVSIDGFVADIASGPNGRFTLPAVPTGSRMVTARRVGFLTNAVILDLTAKGTTDLEIAIERTAVTNLERVVTRDARPLSRDARELDERKVANKGRFLDSTYFLGYPSTRLALSAAPGIRPQVGRAPSDFVLRGRSDCLATLWVNGVREPNEFDSMLSRLPKDALAAMEIYPSENMAPSRFQTPGNTCAVVLVWTKAHINARR